MAVFALLATLVTLAYGNTLQGEIVDGDVYLIARNSLIKDVRNLPRLFVSDWWAGTEQPLADKRYRPLAVATIMLNYAVAGLNPFGYHLVNLMLHFLVTWTLYQLAIRLGWPPEAALVASAIFAVHPLHLEAVTPISNRTELMMALSVLGSLWLVLGGHPYWSVATFVCGLFSKEQAVIFPALLALYDYSMGKGMTRTSSRIARLLNLMHRYGGYLIILGGYLLLRIWLFDGFSPPQYPFILNPLEHVQGFVWLFSTIKMAGHYLWLWLWPSVLGADYSYNAIPLVTSALDLSVLWAVGAWGSLVGLAAWCLRRDRRASFCVGLTAVAFLPVSNFIVPVGTPMSGRFFYLPSAGLCLLVGLGWSYLTDKFLPRTFRQATTSSAMPTLFRWLALSMLLGLCLLLAWRTALRNEDLLTDERFFRSLVRTVPNNAKAHAYLGDFLQNSQKSQDWREALNEYGTALRIYPEYLNKDALFANNLGVLLMKLGRTMEAIEALKQAVSLLPQWSVPYYHLGRAHGILGQYDQAEAALRHSLAIQDKQPEVQSLLSRLLVERGRYAEGLAEAEEVIKAHPQFLLAHYNRALALEGLGRFAEAAASYEHLLTLDLPSDARHEVTERLVAAQLHSIPRSLIPCPPGAPAC